MLIHYISKHYMTTFRLFYDAEKHAYLALNTVKILFQRLSSVDMHTSLERLIVL